MTADLIGYGFDFAAVGHSGYGIFGRWGTVYGGEACGATQGGFVGHSAARLTMSDISSQVLPAIQHRFVGAEGLNGRPGYTLGHTQKHSARFIGQETRIAEKCLSEDGIVQPQAEGICELADEALFGSTECGAVLPANNGCLFSFTPICIAPEREFDLAHVCSRYNTCSSSGAHNYARTILTDATNRYTCEWLQ